MSSNSACEAAHVNAAYRWNSAFLIAYITAI